MREKNCNNAISFWVNFASQKVEHFINTNMFLIAFQMPKQVATIHTTSSRDACLKSWQMISALYSKLVSQFWTRLHLHTKTWGWAKCHSMHSKAPISTRLKLSNYRWKCSGQRIQVLLLFPGHPLSAYHVWQHCNEHNRENASTAPS